MVSSEVLPFAKTGGLADVVASLSRALSDAGHDVKIVMPRYYKINRDDLDLIDGPMSVSFGTQQTMTAVYKKNIPNTNIPVYFIDHEQSFGREGLYGSYSEPDFSDNPLRFSLLCHGALELCKKLDWFPDIIHAHDWQSALAVILPKYWLSDSRFNSTGTVFTIHNLGYQGVYGKHCFPHTGISWEHFYSAALGTLPSIR